VSAQSVLQRKEPQPMPAGRAGYGYEMVMLTRENAAWPLYYLQWAVNAEIGNDAGLLERVRSVASP
jgi:hypothetical protein